MFSFDLWSIIKDLVKFLRKTETERLVPFNYPTDNNLLKKNNKYSTFRWCNRDRLDERLANGYEVFLEADPKKYNTMNKLVNKSDQILIGKLK
ncbi:hypothetical protein [Legionella septentrionalis]|uniref:Uncharacterized protein n=1 Tax=Legionella septentrionalis TaxID=2498109 RepID=A0A3S0V9I4_9GAMM|nr:hypothetical protein [Legionella septentrionalis]RUQ79196.1 hypothetical protein EKM59_11335 [Legionella septentrionalis]